MSDPSMKGKKFLNKRKKEVHNAKCAEFAAGVPPEWIKAGVGAAMFECVKELREAPVRTSNSIEALARLDRAIRGEPEPKP